jgi:hypothetical protein
VVVLERAHGAFAESVELLRKAADHVSGETALSPDLASRRIKTEQIIIVSSPRRRMSSACGYCADEVTRNNYRKLAEAYDFIALDENSATVAKRQP